MPMSALDTGLRIALGLLPVFSLLVALILLDSFKLVRLRLVVSLIVFGGAAALAGLAANTALRAAIGLDEVLLARYLAPVIEELAKGSVVVLLTVRHRVGFLVDAAIVGFSVGAGFAAVENLHYLRVLDDPNIALWIVRGFGTALMHGSVTAIMAIVSRQLADLHGATPLWVFLPGLAMAIVLHSVFNHFFIAPTVSTALILVALPAFFVAVFRVSERRTRDWLGTGFDTDAELLEAIVSGRASASSRIGGYLGELREKFPPATVVDMVCLLRLRLELSIRAKGILLAREAGFEMPADPDMEARFAELRHLEQTIGRTGLLALSPLFHFSDRDLWQHHMLGKR
jgi:RsiW-degrading membrane proteinase PrsW (M82 family)